jgi:hypothetical protein
MKGIAYCFPLRISRASLVLTGRVTNVFLPSEEKANAWVVGDVKLVSGLGGAFAIGVHRSYICPVSESFPREARPMTVS